MSTPSNLYAEKVFAEHPTGLWALDDKADYVSLISENQRVLSDPTKWDITGGTVSAYPQSVDEPFINSYVGKIVATPTQNDSSSVVGISKEIMDLKGLNTYLKTFSVGGCFYSKSSYIAGFEIGYQYEDTTSGDTIQHLKNYDTNINNAWVFISETFDTPPATGWPCGRGSKWARAAARALPPTAPPAAAAAPASAPAPAWG